jgi:hypothetical protein
MAGFYEINLRKMAWDIAIDCADVEGALKGLKSKLLYSSNGRYVFVKNFIKHQKNFPLTEKNNAHKGIVKRLQDNLELFGFQSIEEYFNSPSLGAHMGLISPIGKGKGNGKERGLRGETKKFTPPTLSEVSAYCAERKNTVDAANFVNFYQAKGWFIGKNKMKDWRAAVRTWEKATNKNSSPELALEFRPYMKKFNKDES